MVLTLPEADGFALAGGGAMITHRIVDRTTSDLDCFGPTREAVDRLTPAIVERLRNAGLEVEVLQLSAGFARLSVCSDEEETLLDIGFDPAHHPPVSTLIGAVRALDDLAGDKLLALFSRAEPRDFVDVHALRAHYSRRELEALATAKDLGFARGVLAEAFGVLGGLPRPAFEVDDDTFARLVEEFRSWRDDLLRRSDGPTEA